MPEVRLQFGCPTQIRLGVGTINTLPELLPYVRMLAILYDPHQALRDVVALVQSVVPKGCHCCAFPVAHGATLDSVDELLSRMDSVPDLIVAIGGGTTIDTAKILGVAIQSSDKWLDFHVTGTFGSAGIEQCIPVIAIPTLAGTGSEVSPAALIVARLKKLLFLSELLCPRVALIDPLVACTAPRNVSVNTGIDALVQAIESFVAVGANAVADVFALEAMRKCTSALRRIYADPTDLGARTDLAWAAIMGNWCIKAAGGVGAAHGLSNPLSAHYGLPHGYTVGLLLPVVMRFNGVTRRVGLADMAKALGVAETGTDGELWLHIVQAVENLRADLAMTRSLRSFGIRLDDLRPLAQDAAADADTRANPRPVTPEEAYRLYEAVW